MHVIHLYFDKLYEVLLSTIFICILFLSQRNNYAGINNITIDGINVLLHLVKSSPKLEVNLVHALWGFWTEPQGKSAGKIPRAEKSNDSIRIRER